MKILTYIVIVFCALFGFAVIKGDPSSLWGWGCAGLAAVLIANMIVQSQKKKEADKQEILIKEQKEADRIKRIEERKQMLIEKYGQEITEKLLTRKLWIGMTKEQLLDSRGEPTKIQTEAMKTKTKEIYIYGSNVRTMDTITLENDIVTKFVDK